MTDLAGTLVTSIFQQQEPLAIVDAGGISTINVVGSPISRTLMLCQDAEGDYDVIVISARQASKLSAVLAEWVGSLA